MMRILLLLLVTLAGPFCTFTQATTLMVPTAIGITPETNVVSTQPVVSAKTEVAAPQDSTSTDAPAREATEAAASTKEVPVVSTTAPVTQSETPVEKTTLTDTTQSTEAGTEETATPEATTDIKNQGEDMGTGQLVGIVIGALIAVIVFIAIIVMVARRMGQYSP
ncbi:podoplanin isoform X2 [Labeo rohita]|uniref:podoplanin isoform X2 n=1 Tax=Labeo rohita TaxID=84645 RepID=UPI0021E29068|nr:podoplanin isoform X2 [Labeo rohita]